MMDTFQWRHAWAAGLSIGAAIVHGLVTEEHLAEWWGYGVFFIVAALAQLAYGLAMLHLVLVEPARRWSRVELLRVYWAGIAGNLALVVLYAYSRTVGVPGLGPDSGDVEPVTAIGIIAKLIEIALVTVLVTCLRSRNSASAASVFVRRA